MGVASRLVHFTDLTFEDKSYDLMSSLKPLLFLLLGSYYHLVCSTQIGFVNYDVENAVPFNGSNETNTGTGCKRSMILSLAHVLECSLGAKLDDGFTGPVDSVFDNLTSFFAFSRESGKTGTLVYSFSNDIPLDSIHIVLYFFNSPNNSIGLPSVSLTTANLEPVVFTFDGNSDLSQMDSTIRNVTLILDSSNSQNLINIVFNFENNSRIDWLLISEVEIFNSSVDPVLLDPITFENGLYSVVSLGPERVQSNISLSCTVVNSGSFEWVWQYEGSELSTISGRYQVWTADATRTSILEISGLRHTDSGNYTCRARQQGGLNTQYNKTHELKLNAAVTVDPTNISRTVGQNVSLRCEAYGYLSEDIEWRTGGMIIQTQQKYSLTMSTGTMDSIDSNGNHNGSLVYTLVITDLQQLDSGVYECSSSGTAVNVSVYVESDQETTNTSPSSTILTLTMPSTITQTTPPSSTHSITTFSSSAIPVSTSSMLMQTTKSTSSTVTESSLSTPSTPSPPPPTSEGSSSTLPIIIGSMVAVLIVIALINVAVILIICYTCRKYSYYKLTSNTISKPATVRSEVQEYYAELNGEKHSENYIIAPYSETDFLSENSSEFNRDTSVTSGPPMYEEIPEVPPRGPLVKLAKESSSSELKENPMYASADDLAHNLNDSSFHIYSETSFPPPIPEYHGTPQNSIYNDSIYSVDLNPSDFKSQRELYRDDSVSPYLQPCSSIYSDPQPIMKSDVLEVNESHVQEIRELGFGQFGRVLLAHTIGLSLKDLKMSNDEANISILVAVKRLQEGAREKERQAFEKEIKFMARLRHENVVRLLGVCLDRNAFIMMEYMENGDLNQYLQKFEFAPETGIPKQGKYLDNAVLVYMCLQIAAGMRYLSSLSFVHRDLAARNCLVGQKHVVKISDFGMSRKLYDRNYYRIEGKAVLPIRWMSCECFYGKFSEKTDVWAYGVTVWEIYNFCKVQPYEELPDQEVVDNAIRGANTVLLEKPHTCPEEVYQVMMKCWAHDPTKRASFEDIHGYLSQIHAYSDM